MELWSTLDDLDMRRTICDVLYRAVVMMEARGAWIRGKMPKVNPEAEPEDKTEFEEFLVSLMDATTHIPVEMPDESLTVVDVLLGWATQIEYLEERRKRGFLLE